MLRSAICTLLTLGLLVGAHVASAQDNQGFLYGTVTTESGTDYHGFLRWGTQEAFWDDLFHSLKEDLPYMEEIEDLGLLDDRDDRDSRRGRRGRVRVFNFKIQWEDDDWSASRVFICRFGDIDKIEVTGNEDARVTLRNGDVFDVSGYSDDVGGTIRVYDESLGEIDLKWNRIETINFEAAPRSADPGVERLYGKIETDAGDFEGYVMWDKEECTSADLLDGESEDGDLSIAMGRIRSIERRGRSSSIVELVDGRRLRLRGSNDVDDDNRGIMIEDARFGKVTVQWDSFDRLEFSTGHGSGQGYADYQSGRSLKARVKDVDDQSHEGRLVFDLDEAGPWEMLNGSMRDVSFDIPFGNIRALEPIDDDATLVILASGAEIELEDSQDVSERNDGILLYSDDDEDPIYLPWTEIARIEFVR